MTILAILVAAHFIGLAVLIARDPSHLLDAERARRAKERAGRVHKAPAASNAPHEGPL